MLPSDATSFYDEFSESYDGFVAWKSRLKNESPFFRKLFRRNRVRRVLDVACGTGKHAIALMQQGYEVVGADVSEGMIRRARENAAAAGLAADFVVAGFGQLRYSVGGQFDAIVCLGNSLPHLLSEESLAEALADIRAVLRQGGLFVTQNLNFDKIWREKDRFMPVSPWRARGKQMLFFRFLDFDASLLTFNVVSMTEEKGQWSYSVRSTNWRPIFKVDLERLLRQAGFDDLSFFADYQEKPWSPDATRDLIVVAK